MMASGPGAIWTCFACLLLLSWKAGHCLVSRPCLCIISIPYWIHHTSQTLVLTTGNTLLHPTVLMPTVSIQWNQHNGACHLPEEKTLTEPQRGSHQTGKSSEGNRSLFAWEHAKPPTEMRQSLAIYINPFLTASERLWNQCNTFCMCIWKNVIYIICFHSWAGALLHHDVFFVVSV